jgi:hypothetical protein
MVTRSHLITALAIGNVRKKFSVIVYWLRIEEVVINRKYPR